MLISAAIVYATYENVAAVKSLALQSLNATAFSLASSAEGLLRDQRPVPDRELREVLADRVVAYALVAGNDGVIRFHTNPSLTGSMLAEPGKWLVSKKPSGRLVTLLTGQPAYEYNYTFLGHDGSPRLLRVVLHTVYTDRIVSRATRMWWAVGIVLFLLWGLAFVLWNMLLRYIRIQKDFQKRENVAMVGQMTGVLAHEIRNALAGVRGYTQWVEEKMEDTDPRRAGIAMALQGTERIESLVNELLLFSREEHYYIDSVDLAELVGPVSSSVPQWQGKIESSSESGILVKADKEKLMRVLLNGVQNGVQAMDAGGILSISVRKDGNWGYIEIRDTGTGIDQESFSRLFTPFYTTKTNGTGLGLAYSKKVVESMGGRISLSNRDDGPGAVLTIALKLQKG